MRALIAAAVFVMAALPLAAQTLGARLLEVTQAERLLVQLAREAEMHAVGVDEDFLDGLGGDSFLHAVRRLNDPKRLMPRFEDLLLEKLTETQVDALLVFFESDLGQQIVELEMSAREVMFDDAVEESIRLQVAGDGAHPLVVRMIERGRLTERNVEDTLSSLRQFYLGQIAAGYEDLTEGEVESLLAGSEEVIRTDTQEWLEAYLTFAYSPLADADLEVYVSMWETETGKAYDDALFHAFGTLFDEIGFATGQLVGRLSRVRDI